MSEKIPLEIKSAEITFKTSRCLDCDRVVKIPWEEKAKADEKDALILPLCPDCYAGLSEKDQKNFLCCTPLLQALGEWKEQMLCLMKPKKSPATAGYVKRQSS